MVNPPFFIGGNMAGLLIPDDWDEETDGFCTLTVTVPNSRFWRANVKGQLTRLQLTYAWDDENGDPQDAAAIGQTINDSAIYDCGEE